MLCGWEGNRMSGIALAMRHRLSGISTYRLPAQWPGKGRWAYAPLEYYGIFTFATINVEGYRPTATYSWILLWHILYMRFVRPGDLVIVYLCKFYLESTQVSSVTVLSGTLTFIDEQKEQKNYKKLCLSNSGWKWVCVKKIIRTCLRRLCRYF